MKVNLSMYIVLKSCSPRRFLQNVKNAALDVADAVQEGSWAVQGRVGNVVERLRLQREVRDLREEIDLQMRSVGEIIYAAHKGSPSDSQKVQDILEFVDGLHEELDAHVREQETLQGFLVCPGCGEPNRPEGLYCERCGRALSRG